MGGRRSARRIGSGTGGVSGRAASDEERHGRQDRFPASWLRAARSPHDPGGPRAPRALHGAACAVLRPGNAGPGLRVPDHHHRLPAAGRSARSRHHARSSRAGARHHAVGNQDPHDGCQLCGANADHHACRRCIPGVSSRSRDPASARAVRQRHAESPSLRRPRFSFRRSSSLAESIIIRTSASALP